MNPVFPIYIVSKGRHDTRFTSKTFERIGVPYCIIVEQQELDAYKAVIDPKKLLILDPAFQRQYTTLDPVGDKQGRSKGSGPARNFAWAHATAAGFPWHWVVDDNIRHFYRLNRNQYAEALDGTVLRCIEDFVLRYENIAMAGPNYFMWAPRKNKMAPFVLNTRIYSCNLIRNDLPFRWRGRYNEDTDLSLRMLKAGWCTILFNAFLQHKETTRKVRGGNTTEIYGDGTLRKSQMLVAMHPDIAELTQHDKRFNRWHHMVDYRRFGVNKLIRRGGLEIPNQLDEYGMTIFEVNRQRPAPYTKQMGGDRSQHEA